MTPPGERFLGQYLRVSKRETPATPAPKNLLPRRRSPSHRSLVCLSLALLGVGCQTVPVAIYDHAVGPQQLDVRRYEARVALDVANKSVRGDTAIIFRFPSASPRSLRFPRNELEVDGATYEGHAAAFRIEGDSIVIPLPDSSALAQERVGIAYHSTPLRGLVFGDRFVYTDFHTCHWMVCSEEPGDKADFALEVIAPARYRVIASGRLVRERIDASGNVHSQWEETQPYSPYLYGFVAGEMIEAFADAGSTKLRLLGVAASESTGSLRRKFAETARMLTFLQRRAGVPLPHGVYTQVLVPGEEAQEKSSFALIGTAYLDPILEDPTEDWVIVHELAHQWWGNSITCRDWSHFWLNEGMATFLTAAYKQQRWGQAAYERELKLWRERRAIASDAGFDVPLAYAGQYPSLRIRRAIQYSKAALFLDALRARVGEGVFWRGVAIFTRRHAGGTVTSSDLQRAMQEASGTDLAELFREWVYP